MQSIISLFSFRSLLFSAFNDRAIRCSPKTASSIFVSSPMRSIDGWPISNPLLLNMLSDSDKSRFERSRVICFCSMSRSSFSPKKIRLPSELSPVVLLSAVSPLADMYRSSTLPWDPSKDMLPQSTDRSLPLFSRRCTRFFSVRSFTFSILFSPRKAAYSAGVSPALLTFCLTELVIALVRSAYLRVLMDSSKHTSDGETQETTTVQQLPTRKTKREVLGIRR